MRILLVEDEEVTAAVLRATLIALGHQVTIAIDGLSAWQMFQAEHFPVVLSDWMMPGMDGLALCRHIRDAGGSLYTYIILFSARDRRADRMEGLRAGADDFLVKPLDADELSVRLEIARRILSVQERLERQKARLAELAMTDDLTGLANRREFRRALEANLALAQRQSQFVSLILFDVDRFKEFNDTFGHPAGDEALQTVAQVVRATCRCHEPVARLGGEEFGVILFGASHEQARAVAERIRLALAGSAWTHRALTASFGLATCGPGEASAQLLVEQADAALYFSKREGRDRITHRLDRPDSPCPP
jgi:diguanylate cyclase (GGDEF)-like protein